MSQTVQRYSRASIVLHWLVALLVMVALVAGGQFLEKMENTDPEKIFALRGHMTAGMVIGILMLWRLWVRFRSPKPAKVSAGNAIFDWLGSLTHFLLYLFIFAMVASGIGMSVLASLPEVVFQGVGSLPATFHDLPPRQVHGIVAKLLAGLIILHILASLFHQFILKDRLLGRMGLGKVAEKE